MTEKETEKILGFLESNYPNSYKNHDAVMRKTLKGLWCDAFKFIPFELVRNAVTQIIISDKREFAPNIGQVMNRIADMVSTDPAAESESAWNQVMNFIHNHPQDEYLDSYTVLPETIRRFMKVPDLIQLANNTTEQNRNFEKPRFLKQYRDALEQTREQAIGTGHLELIADPEKIRALGLNVNEYLELS